MKSASRRNARDWKIGAGLGRIKCGLQDRLYLGNLDAKRDWGFAGDYVEAMWLMLQHDEPGDYVVATGETYSVRDFLTTAFESADMNWEEYVRIDERYFRPTEVDVLLGDPSRAKSVLVVPKVFKSLVSMMVEHDLNWRNASDFGRGTQVSLDGIANG